MCRGKTQSKSEHQNFIGCFLCELLLFVDVYLTFKILSFVFQSQLGLLSTASHYRADEEIYCARGAHQELPQHAQFFDIVGDSGFQRVWKKKERA